MFSMICRANSLLMKAVIAVAVVHLVLSLYWVCGFLCVSGGGRVLPFWSACTEFYVRGVYSLM